MLAGELYRPDDPEILADLAATAAWLARYNATQARGLDELHALLGERIGAVGEGAVIRPPFFCDYGFNIRLGQNVFLNFNCVILDVVSVSIGDRTQIGPAVADLRRRPPARRRNPPPRPRIRPPCRDRQGRLDRRRCDHPARRLDRRRRGDRRRRRGDPRRRPRPDLRRQPGETDQGWGLRGRLRSREGEGRTGLR